MAENIKDQIKELLTMAREANSRIKTNAELLATTQRHLTHMRKRAAKRDAELLQAIAAERTTEGDKPAFPNAEARAAELAIRIMTDHDRAEIEGEIAELTITREQQAAGLETSRNELKLLMLEIRAAMLGAGEQPYQPSES